MAANPKDRKPEGAEGKSNSSVPTDASSSSSRRSASFLIRFWQEPGEEATEGAPVRGYVRDLLTGSARYLSSLEDLTDMVRAGLNLNEPGSDRLNELQGGK